MSDWTVGIITVPDSPGSVFVPLGERADVLIFAGANWLTEDVPIAPGGAALFRGMCALDIAGTALLQNAASVVPLGNAHRADNYAILQLDSSGLPNLRYRGTVTSIDSTGFTINFDTVTAGGYKIIYAALTDALHAAAFIGATSQTLHPGWKAGACLLHGAWAGPVISGTDRTQEFYGGAAFPGTGASWKSAGLNVACFPTSNSAQFVEDLWQTDPTIVVTTGMHFTGPFLISSLIKAYPTGAGQSDLVFTGDSEDGGMIAAWDDELSTAGSRTPAAANGDQSVVSGLPFAPAMVIAYCYGHSGAGQGTGGTHGHVGFSVIGEDFQWSALIDANPVQSFQRGFIDNADGISSWHGGTVELTDDGFIMTTDEDSASPQSWVWHAFGAEVDTPGFFRVLHK